MILRKTCVRGQNFTQVLAVGLEMQFYTKPNEAHPLCREACLKAGRTLMGASKTRPQPPKDRTKPFCFSHLTTIHSTSAGCTQQSPVTAQITSANKSTQIHLLAFSDRGVSCSKKAAHIKAKLSLINQTG